MTEIVDHKKQQKEMLEKLLKSGAFFGHTTNRWNPKMAKYIYGVKNNIHIIDLRKTVVALHHALSAMAKVVAGGGRVLFVGTKECARPIVEEAAKRCAQSYVTSRWLGGTLTNYRTISQGIKQMVAGDQDMESDAFYQNYTKKERRIKANDQAKRQKTLGGLKDMGGLPDFLFVIDTVKESTAVREAKKMGIPVAGVVDTNGDPEAVDFPIPGNDDSTKSIEVFCEFVVEAVLSGLKKEAGMSESDVDDLEKAFLGESSGKEPSTPSKGASQV